jgi:hypothetical protein
LAYRARCFDTKALSGNVDILIVRYFHKPNAIPLAPSRWEHLWSA